MGNVRRCSASSGEKPSASVLMGQLALMAKPARTPERTPVEALTPPPELHGSGKG